MQRVKELSLKRYTPSTPATMSKQYCQHQCYKVEFCFDIVAGVDRALLWHCVELFTAVL